MVQTNLGALNAAPNSEIHLIQISHIQTIYLHNINIGLFLDPNNVPNLSITKYRIHNDPTEYIR
jgi:predicted RNA-binding protein with RPS1 domain